jgi:outer membrane protein assembly factor BamB
MNEYLVRKGLVLTLIFSFLASVITPMTVGNNNTTSDKDTNTNDYNFDRYLYPEYYDCYNVDEIHDFIEQPKSDKNIDYSSSDSVVSNQKEIAQPLDGPMDSAWPMYCHDTRHTGRSPYSTIDIWDEIWKFETDGWADSSPAIDENGIIYIGAYRLYAVYPNRTLKWDYKLGNIASCSPAIDENGIIYVGTAYVDTNLYAVYPNGTLKWKYKTGNVFSSPVIGDDGVIYFGQGDGSSAGYINALYSNGTLRWIYQTGNGVYSSPAIGLEGTIYCGSHDGNVYALYPNNGTLRWKYDTGSWVHGSPTIANDGTVYIGSDNGYLYAFYPNNGTVKWECSVGCIRASPALDKDGILYVGVWEKAFYAIYPNGTIKWVFYPGAKIWGSSAAISEEGTIYFGTCDLENTGGIEIIALYSNGTVKWRKGLDTVFSSPAIGSDGRVYIGSCSEPGVGFLNAFGIGELEADANGPYYGLINQPVQFKGSANGGYSPFTSWHWDFGDTHTSNEQNPTHTYIGAGNHTITLTVTDNTSNTSSDTTFAWIQVTNNPPDKPTIDGPTNGKAGTSYNYTFKAIDPDGSVIWYYIDWGDNTDTGWIGPYDSGQQVILSHSWSKQGMYTIQTKAKDPYGEEGPWGTLKVRIPKSKIVTNSLLLKLVERFPILGEFLSRVINPFIQV